MSLMNPGHMSLLDLQAALAFARMCKQRPGNAMANEYLKLCRDGMRSFALGEDGKTPMWCIFDEGDTNYSCMQHGGRRRWASLTRHRGRSVWTVDGWAPPIEKQSESEVKRGAPHKSRRVRPQPNEFNL